MNNCLCIVGDEVNLKYIEFTFIYSEVLKIILTINLVR